MKRKASKKQQKTVRTPVMEFGEIPSTDMSDVRELEGYKSFSRDNFAERDILTSDEI